jgi:hypothetical protein
MAALVSRDFGIDLRIVAEAGMVSAPYPKRYPFQPYRFKPGL